MLDGITTNPTLASKAGLPFPELILKACEIAKDGVVNAEVVSTDTEGMLREGRERASWHSNIVVIMAVDDTVHRVVQVLLRLAAKIGHRSGETVEIPTYLTQEEQSWRRRARSKPEYRASRWAEGGRRRTSARADRSIETRES